MPTAKKLPSGSYRVRVYSHTDEKGQHHYKSFTAKTKKEAERLAAAWIGPGTRGNLTLSDAMGCYIASKSATLSPRTISSYESIKKNYLKSIINKDISKLTQTDIQKAINIEAARLKPHTVANIYGLLTAALSVYRPDFAVKATLPKKTRPDIVVPEDADIIKLLSAVAGTNLELPVLLAAFGPMRRGEICALRREDINGNTVHVCRNIVKSGNPSAPWIEKAPKSYAGDRFITFPDFVREAWERTGITAGRLVFICPDTITKSFNITLRQNNIRPFRFHDLRHYSASIQHALGVPDAYIQSRGGWSSDRTLKAVYRHILEASEQTQNDKINAHFAQVFSSIHDTEHDTKK